MEDDKRTKIINAALEEFAENGFQRGSTNQIAKKAGIAKGMLFYYFNTKQELYNFLVGYCLDYVRENYLNKLDFSETDFIKRMNHTSLTKMQAYLQYPQIFNFLASIVLNQDEQYLPDDLLQELNTMYQVGTENLYKNIDTTLFRSDLPTEYVSKLLLWSIEGYQKELIAKLKGKNLGQLDFTPYWDEYAEFLELLRKIFYQNGGMK
ncbi:MAG: TetR/AcrR family transcriptional regulator [Firmicutes bacterium]|nr:TetR/AcrR family transcriptional regulator [Bacillota bacterium]